MIIWVLILLHSLFLSKTMPKMELVFYPLVVNIDSSVPATYIYIYIYILKAAGLLHGRGSYRNRTLKSTRVFLLLFFFCVSVSLFEFSFSR